jgi:HAD superfamily hydrolase (TIGR01484 family)
MSFLVLATDYDGTLAYDGTVRESTIRSVEKLRESGRKLVLVTGRQLDDLLTVFSRADLFEWIVAENGGELYCPRTRESRLLTEPVPRDFPQALRERGMHDIAVGKTIIATGLPHECRVLETVRDLGMDYQITFNKNAVMILPTGVNKATGLSAALREMKISPHNVVGVGDAENDLPMLTQCECGVAVDNALHSVKVKADFVTAADRGAGVEELIQDLLLDDLANRMSGVSNGILLGMAKQDPKHKVLIPASGRSILVAGPSGSGKSTVISGLIERMALAGYQLCLFDPEGDYETFESAISLGNPHYVPSPDEVLALLERMHNAVLNLLGVSLDARPSYVSGVLRKLEDLRAGKGRPHWIILEEAHHLFPSNWPAGSAALPDPPRTCLMVTVHTQHIRKEALASADVVIAVGKDPHETVREFCRSLKIEEPHLEPVTLERWEALVWFRTQPVEPFVVITEPGKMEHKRHIRKYADGDLHDRSFVFRGADGRLQLCANNFNTFLRMASDIDDDTWRYHLHRHDYSRWILETVKDDSLAEQVEKIEKENASVQETKERIFAAIRAKYTSPE